MSAPTTWTARALVGAIRLYQAARAGRPSPCRFQPSCSVYATDAVTVHGTWRGGWLTLRRLARCHPWGGMGADPVPDPHRREQWTDMTGVEMHGEAADSQLVIEVS